MQDVAAIVEAAARQGQSAPLADRCAVAPILLTAARAHPEAAALLSAITLGEATIDYATLDNMARRFAGGLQGLGLRPGQHIALEARKTTGCTLITL